MSASKITPLIHKEAPETSAECRELDCRKKCTHSYKTKINRETHGEDGLVQELEDFINDSISDITT